MNTPEVDQIFFYRGGTRHYPQHVFVHVTRVHPTLPLVEVAFMHKSIVDSRTQLCPRTGTTCTQQRVVPSFFRRDLVPGPIDDTRIGNFTRYSHGPYCLELLPSGLLRCPRTKQVIYKYQYGQEPLTDLVHHEV